MVIRNNIMIATSIMIVFMIIIMMIHKIVIAMIKIVMVSNDHDQGRIQDLKLGVAQMEWEILKTRGGGGVCYCIEILFKIRLHFYSIYISQIRYVSNTFLVQYVLKPPYLYNIVIKNRIWKNFRGGRAPGAPPSKSALDDGDGHGDTVPILLHGNLLI